MEPLGNPGRFSRRAALVLVAVEKRGRRTGRVRMGMIPDFKATTVTGLLSQHVAPGSTIYTDGLKSFTGLDAAGFRHIARTQPLRRDLGRGVPSVAGLVHADDLAPLWDGSARIVDHPVSEPRSLRPCPTLCTSSC